MVAPVDRAAPAGQAALAVGDQPFALAGLRDPLVPVETMDNVVPMVTPAHVAN
jgi:hypothetical protein